MYKFLILFTIINIYNNLTCPNELKKSYNAIISSSSITTEVCHECEKHCLTCTQKTICTSCENGYYLEDTYDNSYCLPNITMKVGCKHFNNIDNQCIECGDEYWKNGTSCVKKNIEFIQKCKTWSAESIIETCTEPNPGYGILNSGQQFITCFKNCVKCNSEQLCNECLQDFHLSQDFKSCIENQGLCLEWKNKTEELCEACPNGYTVNKNFCYNSQCICPSGTGPQYPNCSLTCASNCKSCSSSSICTSCNSGYYLSSGNCNEQCKENCDICSNAEVCQQCNNQYELNDAGDCVSCGILIFCIRCQNGECLECDTTTMLSNGACTIPVCAHCKSTQDDSTCSECHTGYYLTNDNFCEECSAENCYKCDNTNFCIQCNTGYQLYNDGIIQPSCISCNETVAKYQGVCKSDQWMKFPWNCSDLEQHCLESQNIIDIGTNIQFCQTCEIGYRAKGQICVECTIEHCNNCDLDENDCNQCAPGYYKNTSSTIACRACLDKCKQCTNSTICLDCDDNYAFNNDLTQCVPCNGIINNCQKCWKQDTCLQCQKGYFLDNNACIKCSTNCTDCYNSTHCIQCNDFYFAKEQFMCRSCISNCKICDNDLTCKTCQDDYILSNDSKLCMYKDACLSQINNCKVCNNEDTTKCDQCNEGYYSQTTTNCQLCSPHCLSCTSFTHCQICIQGYDFNSDKTECIKEPIDKFSCFSLVDQCSQCNQEHLLRCSYCKSGSGVNGEGKCLCGSGEVLVDGRCVKQTTDNIDFDSIQEAQIIELLTYINKATSDTNSIHNTEKVLEQLKSQLTTIDSTKGMQAATLLISLAHKATTLNSQSYYKEILNNLCNTEKLDDKVYYSAINAADLYYTIIKDSERQSIYDLGFKTCIMKYLKKEKPNNISVLKLANSELQIQKLEISKTGNNDQYINFSDTQIIATIDLKAYLLAQSETKQYYILAQAINHDGNPYKYKQENQVMYESKLINFQIISKEKETDTALPTIVNIDLQGKTFTITFDFEGTKCGHYNENKQLWIADGNATGKTCQFDHTTHFVIYQETPQVKNAVNVKNLFYFILFKIIVTSIIWIFVIGLF